MNDDLILPGFPLWVFNPRIFNLQNDIRSLNMFHENETEFTFNLDEYQMLIRIEYPGILKTNSYFLECNGELNISPLSLNKI